MKNLTLLFALLPVLSFAQLEVTKTKAPVVLAEYKILTNLIADIQYSLTPKGDTLYLVTYIDDRFPSLRDFKSFSFKSKADLSAFFKLLQRVFNEHDVKSEYNTNGSLGEELTIQWVSNELMVLVKDKTGIYSYMRCNKGLLKHLNIF